MKILVVEDAPKHIQDAKAFFAERSEIEVVWANNFISAREVIKGGGIDGVISDVFFPFTEECSELYFRLKRAAREAGKEDEQWEGNVEQPIGVAVLVLCRKLDIPCVLLTDGFHHGMRLQWVSTLAYELGEIMIDAPGKENKRKHWESAFDYLSHRIKKE